MTHEWKKIVNESVFDGAEQAIQDEAVEWLLESPEIGDSDWELEIAGELAGAFTVLAVCVGCADTGEAAIIKNPNAVSDGNLLDADFWKDIACDGADFYEVARQKFNDQIKQMARPN